MRLFGVEGTAEAFDVELRVEEREEPGVPNQWSALICWRYLAKL